MGKLGVSTQLLAPGDIYPALELGTIDATEFSMPIIDKDFGFHQIAKHYYFPKKIYIYNLFVFFNGIVDNPSRFFRTGN